MLPGRIVCSLPNVSRLVERARASVRILKEAVAKLALALDEQGRIACAKVGGSVRRGATSMWTVLPVRRDLRQDAVVGKNVLRGPLASSGFVGRGAVIATCPHVASNASRDLAPSKNCLGQASFFGTYLPRTHL